MPLSFESSPGAGGAHMGDVAASGRSLFRVKLTKMEIIQNSDLLFFLPPPPGPFCTGYIVYVAKYVLMVS